jgi:hypothetical protein
MLPVRAVLTVDTGCPPAQVLLQVKQLLRQFEKSSSEAVKRALLFLKAHGYQELFEMLEQELRDCLVQLFAILNISQFTSRVGPLPGCAYQASN